MLTLIWVGTVYGLMGIASAKAQDTIIDSPMYIDPKLPSATVVKVFSPRLLPLWTQALERPENEIKLQTASTIAFARRRGMPGLESTVPALLRVLDKPEQNASVRLSAAQALIALDAKETAARLFEHAQADGIDMRDLVEPALARWQFVPVRAVWLERLSKPKAPGRGWLLAIQGLQAAHDAKAIPRLRELARSRATDSISRLEAARALATLEPKGLERDAGQLAAESANSPELNQLIAATLLSKHQGDTAAEILQRLAVEADPAAAVVALDALLANDPRRILPLLPRLFSSRDAFVRARGVEAFRRNSQADQIAPVTGLLNDPHTLVRTGARKALAEVAGKSEFRETVLTQARKQLGGDQWRALEQAALLLTVLDQKDAAPRLVQLLQFDRPEVFVAAAWGLRKLAVPATLKGQLDEIERRLKGARNPPSPYPFQMINEELVQLCQSVGQARYAPAGLVLARFIPKSSPTGNESRAAAIWGLGFLAEKTAPKELVEALIDRLTDDDSPYPEDILVRRMCAVTLGRIRAKDALDSLRKYYPGELLVEPFPNACGWAVEQISGEKMATSGTVKSRQTGWFLEPIE
jgi:hypothetical protein